MDTFLIVYGSIGIVLGSIYAKYWNYDFKSGVLGFVIVALLWPLTLDFVFTKPPKSSVDKEREIR